MDDAVAERSSRNEALLGFVDVEAVVSAGLVRLGAQLRLQFEQVVGEQVFEAGGDGATALATGWR